jgi:hypothetical protein
VKPQRAYAAVTLMKGWQEKVSEFHVHSSDELRGALASLVDESERVSWAGDKVVMDVYRPPVACGCPPSETPVVQADPPTFAQLLEEQITVRELRREIARLQEQNDQLEMHNQELAEQMFADYPKPEGIEDKPGALGPDPAAVVQCGKIGKIYHRDGVPPLDTGTCHLPPNHDGPCSWSSDRIPDARGPEAPPPVVPPTQEELMEGILEDELARHPSWAAPAERPAEPRPTPYRAPTAH